MRKQQVKRDLEQIHSLWIEAIKETKGIGPELLKRIMDKREEIARKKV